MSNDIFELEHTDRTGARAGLLTTGHGVVKTPVFMPVGTLGVVKTLSPDDLEGADVSMILANAYHLYLRPGAEVLGKAGGIHRFMGWSRPVLTDSGGYQVFSLSASRQISDDGVTFRSHIDGSSHKFTPAMVMSLEQSIGADVIMVFDECAPYPCTREYAAEASERTSRWAVECRENFEGTESPYGYRQHLFGIIQGGVYEDLREESVATITRLDFDGYAVGGLAVGEPVETMYTICRQTAALLPAEKARYLMGVGRPRDLVECVARGIDMFDCVVPTRNARKGTVYTWSGKMNLTNARFGDDFSPIDKNCSCAACRTFTRSYIRHLFKAGEMLAGRAATLHNLYFYSSLMAKIRDAVLNDRFEGFRHEFLRRYGSGVVGEQDETAADYQGEVA